MRELVTVIIPVFNTALSPTENAILDQSLGLLKSYPIIFIGAEGNGLVKDMPINDLKTQFITFPAKYFSSRKAFSKLLLLADFYERFSWSEFLLIHPLNTWLLRDELHYWCKQGHDLLMAQPDWQQCTIQPGLRGQFKRIMGPSPGEKVSLGTAFGMGGFYLCHLERIRSVLKKFKNEAYQYRHAEAIDNAEAVFFELVPNRTLPQLRRPTTIVENFFALQQGQFAGMEKGLSKKNLPFAITGIRTGLELSQTLQKLARSH
ncbi:hypothetical protein CLV98_102130 [Dyadobacter jejuensis]|uniref:DUF5672 domain-containing protein n=1 Tax=Dyadobacter jejuensis TaxID=1082580 RepID=A0A316AP92_9BACT|nr:DUF5672 family protein [Dyadobacter jejuensis]PWJ59298.1 hypothetical protein CLV98_102130 [Dyadobacter jejuensis]